MRGVVTIGDMAGKSYFEKTVRLFTNKPFVSKSEGTLININPRVVATCELVHRNVRESTTSPK